MSDDLSDFKGGYSKESQLARGPKKKGRLKAGASRWAQIARKKQGPCRCCQRKPENNLHHLVPRSLGGADTESNIVPLCGSGTAGCHGLIEARDRAACAQLRANLTDDEYAYACEFLGEGRFESLYPVPYEKAL